MRERNMSITEFEKNIPCVTVFVTVLCANVHFQRRFGPEKQRICRAAKMPPCICKNVICPKALPQNPADYGQPQ
jgi:hydroxylamine reductase (hybrid-cluster protein)